MPAWLLWLLNPLNWLKISSLISSLTGFLKLVRDEIQKYRANKRKEKIDEASNQVDQATDFKEKMDAMCKLEKATNPNSDCDK